MTAKSPTLEDLRTDIDHIDDQILALLAKRSKAAQAVAHVKKGTNIYHPGREAQILERMTRENPGALPPNSIRAIYREIIAACRNLEQTTTVAYLGPAGTYSESAARQAFGENAQLVPQANLTEVVRAAEKGTTGLAVVPIENSLEGTVNLTLDLLRQTPLLITGELLLPIHHQLLTDAPTLAAVTEVMAHPQALAQCEQWLTRNLPHATRRPVSSNAEAARLAAGEPTAAAIAGESAATLYHLPILAVNIEDAATNTTRFLVLGTATPTPTGRDKTSLICVTPNRPGALYRLLDCLARHDVNMTMLEARPSRDNNWDYVFHIDIEGHQADTSVQATLADLEKAATHIKILGSYPQARIN
ncbi:MAG TPA: prephenate dehydratase [Candidatus Saccharimonadia bacterium]|nr:prephenate dehydratase [Candidatus Saccharimonadia bacterium]